MAAIGIVVLAIARRHLVRAHLAYATKAIALGVALLVPAAAWFAIVSRTGSEHISGAVHSVRSLSGLATDLAGLVIPSVNQHFTFGLSAHGELVRILVSNTTPDGQTRPRTGPTSVYRFSCLLIFGAVRFRREILLRFAIVMSACSLHLVHGVTPFGLGSQ